MSLIESYYEELKSKIDYHVDNLARLILHKTGYPQKYVCSFSQQYRKGFYLLDQYDNNLYEESIIAWVRWRFEDTPIDMFSTNSKLEIIIETWVHPDWS